MVSINITAKAFEELEEMYQWWLRKKGDNGRFVNKGKSMSDFILDALEMAWRYDDCSR